MSVEEPDMKKLEIAIFSNNANQSEEAFKILKDFISNEKPCTRQVSFFYLLNKSNYYLLNSACNPHFHWNFEL